MIVIRPEQMEAFREVKRRELARWLSGHLRRHCAASVAALDDDVLFAEALAGIRRAEAYGLVASDDVTRFVMTLFQRGSHFDAHPAIQALLTDPALRPATRMDAIFASITEAQWREARTCGEG